MTLKPNGGFASYRAHRVLYNMLAQGPSSSRPSPTCSSSRSRSRRSGPVLRRTGMGALRWPRASWRKLSPKKRGMSKTNMRQIALSVDHVLERRFSRCFGPEMAAQGAEMDKDQRNRCKLWRRIRMWGLRPLWSLRGADSRRFFRKAAAQRTAFHENQ